MQRDEEGFTRELPIDDYRQQIVEAVDTNQVVIITAETGAGKSTQVPQYLADYGYEKVIVTQPRILAARNLCLRVREEWSERTGQSGDQVVGYRTAHERDDHPATRILYCTDGLQLVREITGSGTASRQVLVLDELHEWNENMEVLIAWAKKRCLADPQFRVVIMSATIETDALAAYFATSAVINVPGRSFGVTKRRGKDVVQEVLAQLESGHGNNMLVFLPGKAEIEEVTLLVGDEASRAGVPVIPLHSQLEAVAQQQAFTAYPRGKIILSTNIAQTSVTIDDIDVVIDSGLERRSEVRSGVEGLFLTQVSQADCLQRAGRAGRTKPGEYILAKLGQLECLDFEDRPAYGVPEILRKHIDRLTLRLASIGIDIEALEFFHAPSRQALKKAKRTLRALGAMTPAGEVTRIGREMERFPVESSYGRMLVEAETLPKETQAKLAAIIAIQEVGGIVKSGTRFTGWRRLTRQTKSDLLAQYDVLLALDTISELEYEELGIIGKNVMKAREVMERLGRDLQLETRTLTPVTVDEQQGLLRAIVAGQMDNLWLMEFGGKVVHLTSKKERELSSGTVVGHYKLIAGTPFDLQVPGKRGELETLHLVQGVTAVDVRWLVEFAPQMFSLRPGKVVFDPKHGRLVLQQQMKMQGRTIEAGSEPLEDTSPRYAKMFIDAYSAWVSEQLENERNYLRYNHSRRIPAIPLRQIKDEVRQLIPSGVVSLEDLTAHQRTQLKALEKVAYYLGDAFMAQLGTSRRGNRHRDFQAPRRGWTAPHKRKYDRRKGR